jgi:hypothetical protein
MESVRNSSEVAGDIDGPKWQLTQANPLIAQANRKALQQTQCPTNLENCVLAGFTDLPSRPQEKAFPYLIIIVLRR